MDQPFPPSADDLGISDVEYERIVRALQQRGHAAAPRVPVVAAEPRRRSRRPALAVLGLIAAVLVIGQLRPTHQGPSYAFMKMVNGQPVTYSSCRPVQVALYTAGGPPDGEAVVREAVAELRRATGLDIVLLGAFGGHAPNWNFESTSAVRADDPVSISWQDGEAIAQMSDHTAGVGGSRIVATRNGGERFVAGTVALSRDYYALLAKRGDHDTERAVLLHELGHVFGLAHVASRDELMYKDVTSLTSYGPGDLEGLRRLGQGPCV